MTLTVTRVWMEIGIRNKNEWQWQPNHDNDNNHSDDDDDDDDNDNDENDDDVTEKPWVYQQGSWYMYIVLFVCRAYSIHVLFICEFWHSTPWIRGGWISIFTVVIH